MTYSFPIPHPRGFRQDHTEKKCFNVDDEDLKANGLILYALLARVASNNGTTHEFQTIYDPETQMIELDIPSCYLDFIENIEVGPNIRRYLQWLVGVASDTIANNLIWVTMEELELISVNTYKTPHKFFENSLAVFINGVRVENTNEDGFKILNNETFKLKETYPPNFRISAGYLKRN